MLSEAKKVAEERERSGQIPWSLGMGLPGLSEGLDVE